MLFSPFRAETAHVVQLGPVRIEQREVLSQRHRPAATSKLRPEGVANNTLDTYESENVLISNLPSGVRLQSPITDVWAMSQQRVAFRSAVGST